MVDETLMHRIIGFVRKAGRDFASVDDIAAAFPDHSCGEIEDAINAAISRNLMTANVADQGLMDGSLRILSNIRVP